MKRGLLSVAVIVAVLSGLWVLRLRAADQQSSRAYEYATIRWAGRDNTHIVRPGGQAEFVAAELRKVARPDRADDRALYMNLIMNGLTKEGYRFVGMTSDEIVMERPVR